MWKWSNSRLQWNEPHFIRILHVLCCLLLTWVVDFAVIVSLLLVENQTLCVVQVSLILLSIGKYWPNNPFRLVSTHLRVFAFEMGHITFCVLCLASVLFVSTSAQTNILNDQCKVARSGSMGRCQYLENCSIVLKEISEYGLFPNFCASQDRKQLVCCPLPPTKRTTVRPSTPSRISARSKF